MNHTSRSHTVLHHQYHIIWITKYRYKRLKGALRERIRTIIRHVMCAKNCTSRSYLVFCREYMSICLGDPAAYCGQRLRVAHQELVVASGADGLPGPSQALLGSGLLLHQKRQHHGRCHISVSSGARTYRREPVVIESFET